MPAGEEALLLWLRVIDCFLVERGGIRRVGRHNGKEKKTAENAIPLTGEVRAI